MRKLEVGQPVKIRASIQPGPFSGERLVSFDTEQGPVSGFVRVDDLQTTGEGIGFVTATVTAIEDDSVRVRVNGSFFTTNGLATVKREQAVAA